MKRHRITNVIIRKNVITTYRDLENIASPRHPRIARLLVWMLRKIGAQLPYVETRHEPFELNSDSIIKALQLSHDELEEIFGRRARIILIGREQMHKLAGEIAASHFAAYPFEATLFFRGEARVLGMRLCCVPWMNGWCLLPAEVSDEAFPQIR